MICVSNLTKRFGEQTAVYNISFDVKKGEILGFLGPNGAGKTTTMRIITGFIPPTGGSVTVDGLDIFEHPFEVKKKIGYMPEQPPLYYDMTAKECITFVAEIHGIKGSRLETEISRVSEMCGITHMLSRLTGNLSKGYRQRVGLAQALIHNPEILILDEPTAGLDPQQIIEIRQLIRELGRDRTVILSSHILPEVTNVCGKIAIINNGRLMAMDTIELLSNRLKKGRHIMLKIRDTDKFNPVNISAIDGVSDISEKTANEFILTVSGGDDVLEKISAAVVASGAGLLELREEGMSLEDIFLRIVSGEGSA